MGDLPTPLAAAIQPHIFVHQMALDGVRTGDRELIRQAIQADPLTAAALSLPQIEAMVEELLEANKQYL
jgi:alpha-galactosidase